MAGLLDGFGDFIKTPEGQGLLAATFGGLAGARSGAPINSIGRAGLAGMQGYSGAIDRQQQAAEAEQMKRARDMQMQTQQMQLEQMQAQAAKQKQMEELVKRFAMPAAPALPAIQGDALLPDDLKSGILPSAGKPAQPAGFDYKGFSEAVAGVDPEKGFDWMQRMAPKPADFKVVGNSLVQVGTDGVKPVYQEPQKPASKPSAVQEYEYARDVDGYKGTFQQFQLEQKRAGASSVNVPINMGQKGLDNTLKVRGDFRSEPIYKAHGEVQSAHSQISQALGMNSPAGDLAGATKLMKILDPGSVVRESELGMAMAASGLMDRATNYADMILKGTKLTPTQRKDFQSLADALMNESVKQYSAKRNEYKGIAERNGLSTEDILGPEPVVKTKTNGKKVVKTGMYQGRKVVQYDDGSTGYAD